MTDKITLDEVIKWLSARADAQRGEDKLLYWTLTKCVARIRETRNELHGLLAVIHRDGGHYEGQHGHKKSYDDAVEKVLTAYHVVDDLGKE